MRSRPLADRKTTDPGWLFIALLAAGFSTFGLLGSCASVVGSGYNYRGPGPVDSLTLRLDGTYCEPDTHGTGGYILDGVSVGCLLLWRDGTAAYFVSGIGKVVGTKEINGVERPIYGTKQQAVEEFRRRVRKMSDTSEATAPDAPPWGERDSWSVAWGFFYVEKGGGAPDTVTMRVMRNVVSGGPAEYRAVEYRGVALNDTTLVLTESAVPGRSMLRPGGDEDRTYRDTFRAVYEFYPMEKPDSSNWTWRHPELQSGDR